MNHIIKKFQPTLNYKKILSLTRSTKTFPTQKISRLTRKRRRRRRRRTKRETERKEACEWGRGLGDEGSESKREDGERKKTKRKRRREKRRKRKGKTVGIRIHGVDGYRVPNRDPRDRVIRIEMNVNPLNTIPGQNTATRGSESGQIRYRVVACERLARHDPVGCRSLILSFALDRVQESKGDLPLGGEGRERERVSSTLWTSLKSRADTAPQGMPGARPA